MSAQLCTVSNDELTLLHNKLGHANTVVLAKLIKHIIGKTIATELNFCDACQQGKIHQNPHTSTPTKNTTTPF